MNDLLLRLNAQGGGAYLGLGDDRDAVQDAEEALAIRVEERPNGGRYAKLTETGHARVETLLADLARQRAERDAVKTGKRGLLVHLVSCEGDYTCDGITSRFKKFVLTGDGVPEIFEPSDDAPELRLMRRNIDGEYLHAEPVSCAPGAGPMFGGNFITTSDSRFPNRYPIPVHDRFEVSR